ncbi:MAG: hypothetical protein Cons2KO_00920 [Congregibacter sp.]
MLRLELRYLDAALLAASGLLLSSLIPGGPIENRDFSHLPVAVLLSFNVFLTALALGSFATTVGLLRRMPGAHILTFWAGASYILVYAVDLLGWFPSSPTPMSPLLRGIELTGIVIAIPLVWRSAHDRGARHASASMPALSTAARGALAITTALIVVFSTLSAMGLGSSASP